MTFGIGIKNIETAGTVAYKSTNETNGMLAKNNKDIKLFKQTPKDDKFEWLSKKEETNGTIAINETNGAIANNTATNPISETSGSVASTSATSGLSYTA